MKTDTVAVGHKKLKVEEDRARTWRDVLFWRDLLVYFLAFSYAGHFIEMGWAWVYHWVFGEELATNILSNLLEPYTIYGAGVVLVILIARPLVKRFNQNIFVAFAVTTLVCATLECICSIMLVWRYGHNPYWWYVDKPFNLGGHICLENALLFGLLATVFLKLVYPLTEKILKRGGQIAINITLVVLMVMFAIYYLA